MTDAQVQQMLNDASIYPELTDWRADLCCHIKALADERERLLEGYRQMLQIVSDSHKWHYRIAKAIVEGADLRIMEECEALAAKYARKT